MQNDVIIERIVALRKEMNHAGVNAVILPRTDAVSYTHLTLPTNSLV